MIRGTTPLHTFKFKDSIADTYKNILVTYRQDNSPILEKQLEDLEIEDNKLLLRFTQRESLLFDVGTAFVQIKAITNEDKVVSSAAFSFPITSIFNTNLFKDDGSIGIDNNAIEDSSGFNVWFRGSTPDIYYAPNVSSIGDIASIYLVVRQCCNNVIELSGADAEIIDNDVYAWRLTQEQTLALVPHKIASVRCVYKLQNGIRKEDVLMKCMIKNTAKNEVL